MNPDDLSTQLLYTTLPIWVEYSNGTQGSGTGFIYMTPVQDKPQESIPLLVTNYHVVKDAKRGLIEFAEGEGNKAIRGKRIRVEIKGNFLLQHIDQQNDLAAFPIGPIINQLITSGKSILFRSISPNLIPPQETIENLAAIEEITFIGYPSGLYDEHNVIPIVRRGITATPVWNDFQGQSAFLIDAGVFPGSSGSPVFLFNQGGYSSGGNFIVGTRLIFVGVLSESFIRKDLIEKEVFLGLGKVIKSQNVRTFAEEIIRAVEDHNKTD